MKVQHYTDVTLEEVNVDGAKGAKIRWLISQKDKAPNFAMRLFEVKKGGFTPYHQHTWEHEVFVVEGTGILSTEDEDIEFKQGDAIFVDPQMKHNFRNTGEGVLKFLCIVPIENKQPEDKPVKKVINPFASGKANNC